MSSKYGFNPDPFGAHMKMIGLVGENKTVLDVGCATGYIAEILKKKGCVVWGIENQPDAAKVARNICDNVIIGDIETIDFNKEFQGKTFEVILLGDVLEHLKNPLNTLKKLKTIIQKNGFIVCSIPNVAHVSIRIRLLLGKWEYTDGGLLDKTHLRFFTLSTAIKMLTDAGFAIESIDYTPWIPGFILRKLKGGRKLEYYITVLFPTLFAFQFVFKARPKN